VADSNKTNKAADGAAKPNETKAKKMTATDAAKRVKRLVPAINEKTKKQKVNNNGQLVFNAVDVEAGEVLNFKNYGKYVVVVTVDGQKLTDKPE